MKGGVGRGRKKIKKKGEERGGSRGVGKLNGEKRRVHGGRSKRTKGGRC